MLLSLVISVPLCYFGYINNEIIYYVLAFLIFNLLNGVSIWKKMLVLIINILNIPFSLYNNHLKRKERQSIRKKLAKK